MAKFNFKEKAQTWDATYAFPRPANEQYISSHRLLLRLMKDGFALTMSFVVSIASTTLSFYTLVYALNTFNLTFMAGLGLLLSLFLIVLLLFVWFMFSLDVSGVFLPYNSNFQRESHGGRYWAGVKDLQKEDVDAIRKYGDDITGKGVILAPFKHYVSLIGNSVPKYNIFLSLQRMAQAMIIYGPPGSGKSSTFFIPVIRQFADCGGAIVLDVKGELYAHSAHYYSNVFRLDIQNPLYSDWFDLFGSCYRNPDLTNRIAGYMVGYDPNKNSSKEPIWDQSAVSMLAAIIMLLCEKKKHPTPRDILRFLAENPKSATRPKLTPEGNIECAENGNQKFESYSPLNEAFENCTYTFVSDIWKSNFAQMPKDTFGSVKFNADTAIKQLLSPKVSEILRPPTTRERAKGRRRINFTHLRKMFQHHKKSETKRGSAVFIVVSPSDAMNMDVFLRVIFSVALDTLRESAQEGTNVLVALDEAGNVPLSKLPEGINTDRSKGICYFLGYQDKNQPVAQYGREAAATFLGTAGVNIFLPGVDDDTAEMASKRIGETTILQRSSSDAQNNGLDSEKVSEAGRKLIMPQDLTEMKWFTQCVITIKGAAPIRTKIPNDAKQLDTRITMPQRIIVNVSEEVARQLQFKKGRDEDNILAPARIDQNETARVIAAPVVANEKPPSPALTNPVSVIPVNNPTTAAFIGVTPVNNPPSAASASSSMDFIDDYTEPQEIETPIVVVPEEDEIQGIYEEIDVPLYPSDDFIAPERTPTADAKKSISAAPVVSETVAETENNYVELPNPLAPNRRRIMINSVEVVNENYSETNRTQLDMSVKK